jgi:uncharacterized alpha-E superfamily protein
MDSGRRIERALQIIRLLQACLLIQHSPAVNTLVEESALVAAESGITHRRRYPAQSGVDTVLELLLSDRDNPRSVAFQLDRLASDLRRIAVGSAGDELDQQLQRVSAQLLSVDCATLAKVDDAGIRVALGDLLRDLVDELHQLALAVEAEHFPHLGTLQQLVPTGDLESLEAV